MDKKQKETQTFEVKHPTLSTLIGVFLILVLIAMAIGILYFLVKNSLFAIKALSKLDAIIIVALITGTLTFIGTIVSKCIEYRFERRKYLTSQREEPYSQFMDMVYKIMEGARDGSAYSEEELLKDLSSFSKQITLWGSKSVVAKWNKFRNQPTNMNETELGIDPSQNLFIIEEVMNEMRKDLGVKKVKRGELLSFFVTDIQEKL